MKRFTALRTVARAALERRVTAADCRMLAAVRVIHALARTAIVYLSIPAARRLLTALRPAALAIAGSAPEPRIIWAIEACGRLAIDKSTCLSRALTAELLLASAGRPLTLVIGVSASERGLLSHAWIERDGRVLIGGPQPPGYSPVVTWGGVPA
jgi:hypothetical protein